jgi:Helix-turn-helix domain
MATVETSSSPITLVTANEAARILAVSVRTLARLSQPHGDLRCVRFGGGARRTVRYAVKDLEAWIEQQANSP